MQTEDHELERLRQELDEANREKVKVQSELERWKRTLNLDELMPHPLVESRWLAWVQKLQDRRFTVCRAMDGLRKLAMKSDEDCHAVESSLQRFKSVISKHGGAITDITCWGDMDAMFERLNNTKRDEEEHINWALEVEEGWAPYNTLSSHIKNSEKQVVFACDPAPAILKDRCSLCQGHFGPEGALVMGQCRHTFHVTCITKASLIRSVCPECRSPLSPRFYEMLGILEYMPPGHEYNRWNLPLDQRPYGFQNHLHWGKPLLWDAVEQRHALYEESQEPLDPFVWMTSNRELELRARSIEDDNARELFCRNMGGHWSIQHNKFFRFPEKVVEKGPTGNLVEVERTREFNEQYGTYNCSLVGRALFLSKLEEAAKFRVVVDIDGQVSNGHAMVDVAQAFDKRMSSIISEWQAFLLEGDGASTFPLKDDDEVMHKMLDKVDGALRALKANEVDLTPKRKLKRKLEEDDDFSPETKKQFSMVDMEVRSGGRIVHESQQRQTRRASARLIAKEGVSNVLGESSGDKVQ